MTWWLAFAFTCAASVNGAQPHCMYGHRVVPNLPLCERAVEATHFAHGQSLLARFGLPVDLRVGECVEIPAATPGEPDVQEPDDGGFEI